MTTLQRMVWVVVAGFVPTAGAVSLPGGGPKKPDCHVEIMANGLGFPSGATIPQGTTCADGDVCDADGARNGACLFTPVVCLNVTDPALPKCSVAQVSSVKFGAKKGKGITTSGNPDAFTAAVAALGLPVSTNLCTAPLELSVPVAGPDKKGAILPGKAVLKSKAKTTKGTDDDKFAFTCLPSVGGSPTTTTSTTTTTTFEGQTTTSVTSTTLPLGTIGPGLVAEIKTVTISPGGQVTVTFVLSDAAGVPITPSTASAAASDPNRARVRFTLARILVGPATGAGPEITKYANYILNASGVPSYDTTGPAPTLVDAATATWSYTFGTTVAGVDTSLTHTIGAQVQHTFGGEQLIANPTMNFVPNGSAVVTVREDTTTAQCNACHNPLQAHGGGRREVKLCVLCHTEQAPDPITGNSIAFKAMIHRIHRGKDLPSVTDGAVGANYSIGNSAFGEKVKACVNGPFPSAPCSTDADCGAGGTCTGTTTEGVGFPQDLRNCTKCHSDGATHANYLQLPSTLACTGCHDDVNPGLTEPFNGLDSGVGHINSMGFPETACNLCHVTTQGSEFDISIPGAHVIPARSATLPGLTAAIVAASGTPGNPVQVQFRLRDGMGNPITSYSAVNPPVKAFSRIAFAISGSTAEYGASPTTPLITPTAFGGGATGVLTGPDGTGLATYTTATNLPADAVGTWAVGLEARRPVTVNGSDVNEAAANPVAYFSVDGSTVEPRREIVAEANCSNCHGTFSKDFSIHGNLRNQVEYCAICHNPKNTDGAQRKTKTAVGADPTTETIAFRHMIHKIHRGESLENPPYIIYGFGGNASDFADVRFPGDLRDCAKCHTHDSQLLPLTPGHIPTNVTAISGGVEGVTGTRPPIQDACLACHDADDAAAHAETNTTASGAEACGVCHGEGSIAAVSEVHAVP